MEEKGAHRDSCCIDTTRYCGGKGKLLRAPNIQRPDGNYKVQLSYEEFKSEDLDKLILLVKHPRCASNIEVNEPQKSSMCTVYDAAKYLVLQSHNKKQGKNGIDSVLSCEFLRHCYQNQETLKEAEWFRMVSILMSFGEDARPLVHEFSRDYPNYTTDETDNKINYAKNTALRVTCNYVNEIYTCERKCNVHSPVDLFLKQKSHHEVAKTSFAVKQDGVYFSSSCGFEDDGVRLCSPMKIQGKMRNPDGLGWARLVEFTAPDGQVKKLSINMRDCTGRGDVVRALLSDNGLEIFMGPKINTWLMEYIQHGGPEDTIFLQMDKVGWHNNTYVLPDVQFGDKMTESIYYDGNTDDLHKASGTLADWHEHVGRLCEGNSLLVLAVSYALTGPLLRPCGMEGGGLHVYGSPSTGKTTCALVAGSVCGGGGNRGYLRQWRSTHNALESTATMHNDNLLVLDEVGQATAEVVSQVAYMLPNGQGRERMRADTSRRKALTWRLNFFSTGELTINDKIEETGKMRTMAGQVVRIIDLPVDGGTSRNLFEKLHGHVDTATLSTALASASTACYGAPLRTFLEHFCQNLEGNSARLLKGLRDFANTNVSTHASGQVKRVADKFGLLAIAGELVIEWGIFPLSKGEALDAAVEWFKIWLE